MAPAPGDDGRHAARSHEADDVDVAVLGAGPAGLAVAHGAAAQGLSVTVLERSGSVGGMAAGLTVAGVAVDRGSHRLHPAAPEPVLALLRDLLGDDLQVRARDGRLRLYGRWVAFPLRATELARVVPPGVLARVARDAVTGPLRHGSRDSYAAVLRSSLGPTLYGEMYAPYARKLWGRDGEDVDAEQARVRVTADTPAKVAARLLRRRRGPGPQPGRTFSYPRRGFGQITTALHAAAEQAGATVRCGAEVTRVSSSGARTVVSTADGRAVRAARVLSTLPLPLLARVADPPPPGRALRDAAELRYRAMVLVYLVHGGPPDATGRVRWTRYDAHYLPGGETPVSRVSEPVNYRDSADDPRDRTVLCAEIPCDVGDDVWRADDTTLADTVRRGLAAADLPPVVLRGVHVERLPVVYPVYARGFGDHLAGLEAWADGLPGVTTLGRAGLFAHDNTHHALVMAAAAAAALRPGGGWDDAAWAAARAGFRSHVVED